MPKYIWIVDAEDKSIVGVFNSESDAYDFAKIKEDETGDYFYVEKYEVK